jgi:DNA-binding IclR family transcriptional regulator
LPGECARLIEQCIAAVRSVAEALQQSPGLRLTAADIARLTGEDLHMVERALAALESARFLSRAGNGTFLRAQTRRGEWSDSLRPNQGVAHPPVAGPVD